MIREKDTGFQLNLENTSYKINDEQDVTFDIYKLRVDGGFIYYRDLSLWTGEKIIKMSQSGIFIADSEETKKEIAHDLMMATCEKR